ncbi:MAG: hypothetical protein CO108_03515 [Deltaproteobacteria bacterium CG_4_9_14_3_um_filter_63_12]|nr:MAG: hypothetical protein CO108_03515 [Deltaproteobacteria bacterium CG_4_9_14_3_um_filter_63_12]
MRKGLLTVMCAFACVLAIACGPGREQGAVQTEDELIGGKTAGDFGALMNEAAAAWEQRADRKQLTTAITAWEKAIDTQSEGLSSEQRRQKVYVAYVSLARAYYFLADGHIRFDADDVDDVAEPMMAAHDKGTLNAEKAMAVYSPDFRKAILYEKPMGQAIGNLDEGAVDAMYWWSANIGKWALIKGLDEALSRVDSIKATMERVMTLDPDYFYRAPNRYFGSFYTKLPFPTGDLPQSKQNFEAAIAGAPNYLATRVLYAELYGIKTNDKALFEAQLNAVLAAPDGADPAIEAENQIEKRKAKQLLDTIDDYF